MSGINEAPLDPKAPIPTTRPLWSCPTGLQFRIVRAMDIGKAGVNCNMLPDPATPSALLTLVRQTLRDEDWYVDMADQCIVAKGTGADCYGTPGATPNVAYIMTDAINANDPTVTSVSYASICYRTN